MTSPSSPQPSPAPASGPRQPTRLGALRRWFTRLRSGFGVPAYELQEVDNLGRHIWHRLSSLTSITTLDDSQLADWVNGQFTYPLRNWLLQASRNTRGHVLLSLVVIGGGFATSGIAVAAGTGHKGSHTSWVVFSIGLVVALAGGVSQLFRPGYRATQRTTLAIELREEGWAFANSAKDYNKDVKDAFERFNQRVSDIHRRAAQVAALEPDSKAASTRGGRGRT